MKQPKQSTKILAAGVVAVLGVTSAVMGQSADALIDKLVEKGVLNVKEANDLREEADKNFNSAYSVKSGMPDWVTALKLNGDVRLRYENFNYSDKQMPPGGTTAVDRHRFRYRLRFGVTATLKDNLEAGFRLTSSEGATGGVGGDPISGNTTMTSNGSKKLIFLDLAYAKWNPINTPDWSATLIGGKMENPFVMSDMAFDGDYTPEGAALQLSRNLGDKHTLKLNGGGFVVNEVGAVADDAYLFGGQLRWDANWSPKFQTTAGVGMLALTGNDTLGSAAVPNQNRGNTRGPGGNLVNNYNPIVADVAATYSLESFPYYTGAFPIKLAGDYIHNPVVQKENYGWSAGLTLGKSGKKGLWDVSYRWKYLQGDAWYEELVDSDTGAFYGVAPSGGGTGYGAGTNVKGHVIKATYSPYDSMTVGVTYFLTSLINEYAAPTALSPHSDAGRLQVDMSWKF